MRRFVPIALVLATAARLSYLFAAYLVGFGGVERHHVESTATVFAVVGVVVAFLTRAGERVERDAAPISTTSLPLFVILAISLYLPALFIGPLSDDFVLMHRAGSWDVSAVSTTLFRPIPLLAWSAILAVGGGPFALHALNVVLHGVNSWLSARAIGDWVPSMSWAATAGLLVLAAPLAPEAVAWASGIFDVSAAALVLTSILVARRYRTDDVMSWGTRARFVAISFAAVLCKETAAVGPVLVLLVTRFGAAQTARRSLLVRDAIGVAAAVVLFGGARFLFSPEPSLFHFSKYAMQRTLFAAFGALASPFHADVLASMPWLALCSTLIVICLWSWFFVVPGPRRELTNAMRGIGWVLVAIAPAWAILVVPADLQASRFLYLAGTGWVLALVVSAASVSASAASLSMVPRIAVITLLLLSSTATRVHLGHWREAADARDAVLRAATANEQIRSCDRVSLADVPDTVRGAYVFRNGLAEALAAAGITLTESGAAPECRFEWDADDQVIRRR
jgi:hypothetical protein